MPRWLKIFLWLFAVLALAAGTLPWWLGTAARPIAAHWGVTFTGYERLGYTRFRLAEVRYARNQTTVIAHGVEASTPLAWLKTSARQVTAQDWLVDVKKNPAPSSTPGKITGLPSLHTLLGKISGQLHRWLPRAELGRGEVRWPLGGLTVEKTTWHDRTLHAQGVVFLQQTGDLVFTTGPADSPFTLTATFASGDAQAQLTWHTGHVQGTGLLWSQPLALRAEFPPQGWSPTDATADAANWDLSAERVKLAAQYTRITGGGTLRWHDGAFTLSARADAAPKDGVKAPKLAGRIEANGDRRAVTLTALELDAPFAQARLTAPVVIGFDGQPRGDSAKLSLEADLAQQPWIEAKGRVRGTAEVSRFDAPLEFQLEVADLTVREFAIARAEARGRWLWPQLEITQLDAQLDAASKVSAAGRIDWRARSLAGVRLDATLGRAWFARWLPETTSWTKLTASATADGSFDAPQHTGALTVTEARTPALKPFDLTGTWRGLGRELDTFSAEAAAGSAKLTLAGRGDAQGLDLREFNLISLGAEPLALAGPARVTWSPVFQVANFKLQNAHASLAAGFTAGARPAFTLAATNFDKEWLGQWIDLPGPTWIIRTLEANGETKDDILNFSVTTTGEIKAPQQTAQVALTARGDARGITITDLKLTDGARVLTQLTGKLPVTWSTTATPHLRFPDTAPLELAATVLADSPLWPALAEPAGLTLTSASASAQLTGTLKQPQGELRVDIASLKVAATGRLKDRLPDVDAFALRASAGRDSVRVDSLAAKIEGQEIRAQGRLPMDDGRWRELVTRPAGFSWDDAEGTLEIPGADLAPLARRLPALVAAQGRLQARVELARGGNLTGSLTLGNAATRPIPGLGTAQEINGTLSFAGREATVENFTAKLGGEPVTLTGTVQFPRRAEPRYALKLAGKNLPLVRRAGLLLRSDLALQAHTDDAGTTRVSGLVTLRDGLVLSDLEALLPSGTRGVSRRPPYFAVEAAPFNRWQLAVEVRGKNAVRVRTPVFTGTASAHFDLTGTLGDPRAIGEVAIDQGQLFFPFATFTVQAGAVRLRAADPFTPQLNVNAISRRRNYELRLEVSGTPEAPVLVFSSNPPLEASEVLLMVMAGQMPASDVAGTTATGGVRLGQIGAYLGQGIYRGLGGTGESRLEIVTGEQVSRQGRETYEVAYKLGEKWTLVGEYDEFDAYNAGLKWRIYTQEGANEKK